MAEPARRLDDDQPKGVYDEPTGTAPSPSDPRPNLRALEGGGQTTPRTNDHLKPAEDISSQELSAAEDSQGQAEQHENQVGRGYRSAEQPSRFSLRRRITPTRAVAGGGILSIIILIMMFIFASGPLEFVHLAQLLEKFHFSALHDQSDDRFMQEARYIRYKVSGKVYKSNLGIFQNYIADKVEARLSEAGIEPVYNNGSFGVNRDGWMLDPEKLSTSDFEDFSGKSPPEIKQYFDDNFPGVDAQFITSGDNAGKIFIDESSVNSSLFGHSTFSKLSRTFLKSTGMGTVSSAESARILSKRAGSTWHPISRARDVATVKFVDWVKGWIKSTRDGTTESIDQTGVDDTSATDQKEAQDFVKNGGEDSITPVPEGTPSTAEGTQTEEGLKLKAKLTGAGLAALTVACQLQSIDNEAKTIKEAKVVYPLMREANSIIGLGNQIMNGGDLTAQQVNYFHKLLDGPSLQTEHPNQQTSWYNAASIQAELGNGNTGIQASSTLKDINQDSPFHFLNTGITGATLSTPCAIINSKVALVISVLTAPELTAISYTVSQFSAVKHLYDEAVLWAAGKPLNLLDRGADFGNDINYGARLAANAQAVSSGGRRLSDSESGQLALYENEQSQEDFQSHNLAYRLFNPYDERSSISQIIDQENPNPSQGMRNVASAFLNFGHFFSAVPKIFSPGAHAASSAYDYGFPEYGFSTDEMNNPLVKNPYKNADDVVSTILPAHPEYIQRVSDCFGVTIDPSTYNITSLGANQIDPSSPAAIKMNFYQQPGSSGYNSDCADTSSDWMQVRFYVFDTQTMASVTCYLGDNGDTVTQQACSDIGADSTDSAGAGITSSGDSGQTSSGSGSCSGGGQYSSLVSSGSSFAGKDQGIDFVPSNSTGFDICAPASGTIVQADATGHHFDRTTGQTEVVLKMDQPPSSPSSGSYIYFIELIQIDSSIKVGMHVNKGQVIGHNSQSPGIEVGWATGSGGPGSGLQPACGVSNSPTPCGESFNSWILAGGGT